MFLLCEIGDLAHTPQSVSDVSGKAQVLLIIILITCMLAQSHTTVELGLSPPVKISIEHKKYTGLKVHTI